MSHPLRPAVEESLFPRLKPMAKVTRVTLFEREVRERLSDPAVEILLGAAQVLSEGQATTAPSGSETFFGSSMVTIDLSLAASAVREPCDEAAAKRVAALMASDPRVARRARSLAEREAARLAGRPIKTAASEVRVRAEGTRVFIDIDFESTPPYPARREPV